MKTYPALHEELKRLELQSNTLDDRERQVVNELRIILSEPSAGIAIYSNLLTCLIDLRLKVDLSKDHSFRHSIDEEIKKTFNKLKSITNEK